jgi:hypothetical protein
MLLIASNATSSWANESGTAPVVHDMEMTSSSQLYYAPPGCLMNQSCPYGLMNYFQAKLFSKLIHPLAKTLNFGNKCPTPL